MSVPLSAFGDVLTVADLAQWRGLSVKRMYAVVGEGTFDFARVRPFVGKIEFSKARLQAWADGERMDLTVARRRA